MNAEPRFYDKREWFAFDPGAALTVGRYLSGTLDARIDE
jgi:hypothetical protein